jgi:chemosensory pili system protein ChpA (sensor histidine kinase/response regulator)
MPPPRERRTRHTPVRRAAARDQSRLVRPLEDVATAVPYRQTTILVVEDDPALLSFYRSGLMMGGFTVVTASDGLEALQRIESHIPDLVVLDLGLPRLSGRDVRREIAAHAHTQRIPIVVVTGEVDTDPTEFNCVLRKPVYADALIAAIERCLKVPRR